MPLDLESLRAFVKVAELGSFTKAGAHLATSKSRVSLRVSALEAELGAHLFVRSTRAVRLTSDGEQLLGRARALLAEADELEGMFHAASALRGPLRVDMPIGLARNVVIPRLPELLAANPKLELALSTTDRRVDVVREGFDCVVRVGALADSGLTVKRLGVLPMANCASPAYLHKHGTPRTLDDLAHHFVVHYAQTFGADAPSFEYPDGDGYRDLPMRSLVTVNNSDAYQAACVTGLGIIQAPRMGLVAAIASGALVEILPDLPCAPMPLSIVHGHGRSPPRRVRAFMAWAERLLAPHVVPAR